MKRRARRDPRRLCPRCGLALESAGGKLACPNCGYARLTPPGRAEAEAKLLQALGELLARTRGNQAAVTFRKLAQAGGLDSTEARYLTTRWRALLPPTLRANGRVWRRAWKDGKRVFYACEVGA